MGKHEAPGATDEWYTPAYVFEALGCRFDLDVASPAGGSPWLSVPANVTYTENSLSKSWHGFVWMNPPFGKRMGLEPWLAKFFGHGNGIALAPDRTSVSWWQSSAKKADAVLFVSGKIKFVRPDGTLGRQPGQGTTLFACGPRAVSALRRAEIFGLGHVR